MAKNPEKKVEIIEHLVIQDLGNGKHAKNKLNKVLNDNGKCSKSICQELHKIKISR